MNAAMVYDIILVVAFLFIIWRGWHQGMLSEILRLAGWAVAIVLTVVYSAPWAQRIYFSVVEGPAVAAVTKAIPPDVISALESGAMAVQSLRDILSSLSGFFGTQIVDDATVNTIIAMCQQDAGRLAQAITQTVLQPLLITVTQVLLSVAFMFACLTVSRFLARLVAARRGRNTILSRTNRLLGAALGVGEGLVTVYVYVFILSLVAVFVTTSWLSQDVLRSTHIVRLFL